MFPIRDRCTKMKFMMRARTLVLTCLLLAAVATPARADLTGFIGATTTPENRLAKGFAIGTGFLIFGFEFEYANTSDDPAVGAPSLTTGMGNGLLQTPAAIFGFQPYFTAGGGIYRETLGTVQNTNVAANIGGGVKISLVGPLRLRVDYRLFKLGGGALYPTTHRIYAGLNLKF